MTQNVYERIAEISRASAGQPCLILPDSEDWTYGALTLATSKAAGALDGLGVGTGDRVLVQIDKSPHAVALYLACLQIGAVYVPINSAYTSSEVAYFLNDAEPRVFVCAEASYSQDRQEGQDGCGDATVVTLRGDGSGSFADLVQAAAPRVEIAPRAAADLAAIVYTSGTTGRSKGAMLTHGNLISNADTLCAYWGWQPDDVLLHALPIFHVHGLFVALHCVLFSGTSMIFLPTFDADRLVEFLPSSTVLMGVPTFYTRLVNHPNFNRDTCRNMRVFISGSAPLTEQTFDAFEEMSGHKILERYGMSETQMITSNPLDGDRVAGTVGFALPGVEVRITDDAGTILPADEVGGIEVQGPNVFPGYWRMPEKTAEEFRADGFFKTGDLGIMDGVGRVSIVGREKDLVISGGYNVYPKEVEKLIDEMQGVVECAVIGVPHADFGEGVVAVVVATGAEVTVEMVDAALDGQLARFKQPKSGVCVDTLPRNTMGKVQKNQLREDYKDLFAG
ncbi:MAG: AMP-binding protein [Gammaproteobacteria bacterium]|nr:AMP-binding protein [Gammaproteobacteria bacterium]